jgi:hypothetical protein
MCVATTATTAVRLFESVRIKCIEIWACNAAGDASNTVQLEWVNTVIVGAPGSTHNDTAMGLQNIAHISCKPPKFSRADFWLNNSSGGSGADYTIANLNIPKGGVIDVVLEACLYDNDTAVSVTGAVAGATTGKTYCRPLDSASGTAGLDPIGYDSI